MATFHPPYLPGSQGPWADSLQAGLLHNYYLNSICSDIITMNLLRGTPPFYAWLAQLMFDNNAITAYEMSYISNIHTTVGGPTTPIGTAVTNLQNLLNTIVADPLVTSPALRAVISIGLASAQNGQTPPPFYPATINWGNVWTDDLAGGAIGVALGGAVGAAIGGVAASGVSILIGAFC